MPIGAGLFVEAMQRLGLTEMFTLVGDHLNDVLPAAAGAGIRIIDVRHESSAMHAADALARARRRPALALVTGGPGHTNALTGLATAYQALSPLIAVSGAPALASAGRQVFQVIDQVAMAAPVCKWAAQAASPDQIPYLLGKAYAEASSGRMGPVHLSIPVDVFAGSARTPLPMQTPPSPSPADPASADVRKALRLLSEARKPVVIAGSGVWWSGATQELRQFLRLTRLPYFSLTMARGLVTDLWRYNFRYADGALNKAVHQAFPEADVVLVLGKRIDYRLAMGGRPLFSPEARFVQVDIHAPELGANRELELGICADVRATLGAFLAEIPGRGWPVKTAWIRRLRGWEAEWRDKLHTLGQDSSQPIHPAAFYAAFHAASPAGTIYSWDGGEFVHWGRSVLPALVPGAWYRLGPLATIGSALPNAIALRLEHPTKPLVVFTGDGALGFYLAEMDTLVRHRLPVVIVVGNDSGWGVERELQSARSGTTVACELSPVRYDLIMKAFGGEGEHVERLEDVGPALSRAFASGKPYVLDVAIRGVRSPFTEWAISRQQPRQPA